MFLEVKDKMIKFKETKNMWSYLQKIPWYIILINVLYGVMFHFFPCPDKCFELAFNTRNQEKLRQVYRWYTYSLVHLNASHIISNVIATVLYGFMVEYDNLALRTAVIHSVSIVGGAFGCGWEHRLTGKTPVLVGASGGCYGLLSSQVGNLIINWPEIDRDKRIIYVVLLVSASIVEIVVNSIWYNPKISYSTHIGGFFTGIFIGSIAMHNIIKIHWERRYRIACWIILMTYMGAGMINVFV
jgi:membrane associated rhomboid family serine protease